LGRIRLAILSLEGRLEILFMEVNEEKLKNIKNKAEQEYREIDSIYCPYFKDQVAFNSKGLEHIKFKDRNKTRSAEDQYIRLRCLPLASKTIEASHTLQGIQERNEMVRVKKIKWAHVMKRVTYFEFIAVINDYRVRVIIKKVYGGESHFWSIIPFWRTDMLGKRLIYSGNPGED